MSDVFFLDEAPWQILDRATAQRKLLLNSGYVPIPINGKAPIMSEWQKQRPSIGDINKWPELFPSALNTGVLTRITPTVDIDVYDAAAVEELQKLLWDVVGDGGHTMVRVGQAPKCAIPFQTDQPFAKVSTPNFTSPDGRKHHVEVLSDGQQIVVFGKHPDTGSNYTWRGGEPGNVVRDALPYINATLAADYIAKCTDYMRALGWQAEDKKNGQALPPVVVSESSFDQLYGEREQKYALAALSGCAIELAGTVQGSRNEKLNAAAFRMATMIAPGWIDEAAVIDALLDACNRNHYLRDHGRNATMKTIRSGLEAGRKEPPRDLPDREPSGDSHTRFSGLSGAAPNKQQRAKAETGTWDEPDSTLLDDRRGELPDFPVNVLGERWQVWIELAARGAGVTLAHVAVPLIAIASALIGTARRVQASRSWSQPMTLWAALVGASGTGKTPGIDATKRALSWIDRLRKEKIAKLALEHQTKAEAANAERKLWKKQVEEATAANQPAPAMPASAADPGVFVAPRLYVSDATIERMAVLLLANPRGMLRLSDELSGLFLNMSRYSGGQDNEFWLEAWNGNPYLVERMGRPPISVEHLLVGVVGGLQPDKLSKSFIADMDGMYARILFCWPPEPNYQPLTDDVTEFEPEVINALSRLVNLPCGEEFTPKMVPLSSEARARFEQLLQFVHRTKNQFDGREREWFAKVPAHVLRLSGTLCFLDWAIKDDGSPEPGRVDEIFMSAACRLVCDYLWPHSRAALRQIGLSERHANSRRVLRWIKATGKTEVSIKDIRRDALGGALDADQTQSLVEALTRSGWLRAEAVKPSSPKGGKPVRRWQVNSLLWAAETAETAETSTLKLCPEVSAVSAVSAATVGGA